MRRFRSSILLSLLMLVLCASIIVGSTLAYFTDEVSTTGNVIASGTLDASMFWADQLPSETNGVTWQDASDVTLFNNEYWEPNATVVKYIRIDNTGKLAFQYELNVLPTLVTEGGANLMDVIDVYFGKVDETTPAITRSNYATLLKPVGVMSDLLTNEHGTAYGILLPEGANGGELPADVTADEGSVTACVVLHMQETAGNEYQGLSAGEGFNLQLVATQYTYEKDAFGNQYDAGATLPDVTYSVQIAQPVTADENGLVAADVHFTSSNGVAATVPAGAKLADGVTQLVLVVHPKAASANVQLNENDVLSAYEVRVEGLAKDNTVPVLINLGEVLAKGLNIGNYNLYHVENGATNPMTLVDELTATSVHNSFTYAPATGEVSVAMATFSEVAMVADTENAWNGEFDYSWYTNALTLTAEDATAEYIIANADQLAAFGAIVGGMNGQMQDSFGGKTVKLISDINLGDEENENNSKLIFYPIGYYNSTGKYEKSSGGSVTSSVSFFEGIFDGNGHTIANFYQNTWEMFGDYNSGYSGTPNHYNDAMGLFGYVYGGTIKNLTVDNFSSDGEFAPTGVIAAYAANATFENIAITNCNPRVYNTGNGGIVGIGGNTGDTSEMLLTFTNITVDNSNKISALWGSWDVACGGLMGMFRGNADGGNGKVHFENCHVSAQIDVYNDVCANYQYYAYRYAGMIIGSIRHNTTNEDGKVIPNMAGISATGCTVNYGDWNDYYYCEFEKNSLASYSEDYQFSRVPHDELIFTDSNGNGSVDADERASVTGCKHNHTDAEDKKAVYLPFHQLFTGYSWGVNSIGLEKYSGIVTDLDITEGDQQESVEKFAVIDQNNNTFTTGTMVAIGDLFTEVAEVTPEIDSDNVQVFVSPVDDSTASGVYEANTTDWSKGTLTFSGLGAATITITDYYFCTPTVVEVEIIDRVAAEKFETKFTGDFLYRVGNQNAVSLGSLFKAKDDAEIGTVSVTVEAVGDTSASGVYTADTTDWTKGTIQFSGTGVVKVTITDNDYCTPTELYLEVVDAKNATSATSATANNVVLLNDISSGFKVSGRYAVYGNGFTLNYTGNGQYLNNGLKQGVVTVSENGTLDNLRIKASIYPAAYLYYGSTLLGDYVQEGPSSVDGDKTRYHYQLSAVAASGNATISNCYIYGGRNNIFVNTGDVTIKDTVLECGTVANVQIQSDESYTVTFEDVTTIQHQVNPTIGQTDGDTSKVMLGAGVLVGPDTENNPTIVLNGAFKQYNWVTADDANAVSDEMAKTIIDAALKATSFNHTVNGKNASNLGIIYMNTIAASVTNNTGLPYEFHQVSISGISGKVYSLQNATANQIYSDYDNADKTTVNGWYQPQFKYSDDLGGQYIAEGGDEHCYREGDTINVMFPSGDTKELDLAGLVNIVKYTGQDLRLAITCKDSSGNSVTVTDGKVALSAADDYTVTYTVTDKLFFDKDGKQLDEPKFIEYSWDVTISVSLKDTAVPDAYFEFDRTKQVIYRSGNSNIKQFIPFLAGLKIYDYNGQTEYLRFDGDKDFNKIAKASIDNINTTGEAQGYHIVTVELVDGGKLVIDMDVRANSGSSTHTGSIKVRNNVIYVVNGGTTSGKGQTWKIYSYKFVGNNGTEINSGLITFGTAGVDCSTAITPSSNFGTTIKHAVTYDANGGNCGQTTGYATSVSTAVTLPTPTRSGYIFAGWYTAVSSGTRVGGAGESYTPSANITLYAQWDKPCTVTYNANGGSCGTASEKYTGTALTLPTPTRDGYWFVGWYDAATGGNKIGYDGATYTPSGDITLYAHWQEAVEYTVTYNANGGTCDTDFATYEGTPLTLPTPTRTGYKFLGWYDTASGGTKIGDAGAPYTPSANITLYAQWQINSYTITVTTNNATVKVNGTTVNNNGTVSIQYGAQVTVEVTYFKSYDRSTTINGTDGTTYTSPFTMPAQDVTINATSSSSSCVTPDTRVTLADGTKKEIQYITYDDQLLVWDFFKGEYATAPASIVINHGLENNTVITLKFSDGTEVKAVNMHTFMDATLNKMILIDDQNVASLVGHSFVKVNGSGYTTVELVDFSVSTELIEAWGILSAYHYNAMVEDMFSISCSPSELDTISFFEVGEAMKYDEAMMKAAIEAYGLYTYDEFSDHLTPEQFEALSIAYMKISVGKGLTSYEYIIELIETYIK